jgi:hypothetical protein
LTWTILLSQHKSKVFWSQYKRNAKQRTSSTEAV